MEPKKEETKRARLKRESEERALRLAEDVKDLSFRPSTELSYANFLYAEAMAKMIEKIDPVSVANWSDIDFDLFAGRFKKSIQRFVKLTLEAQIENNGL